MKIESNSGHSQAIAAQAKDLSVSERATLAMKKGGAFLGAALFSVFIPVLHFFLVPLFLLLSLYFGIKNFRYQNSIDLTGAGCPACGQDLNEGKRFYRDGEVRLHCYKCQTQLKVS